MIEGLYLRRGSALHRLNVWTKFGCLLILLPLAAFIADGFILLILTAICVFLVSLAKIPLKIFWQYMRLYLVVFIILFVGMAILFSPGNLGQRIIVGSLFALRLIDVVAAGALFSMITDPMEIPVGLLRLRIPHRYGITLMVAYRMLPLMADKVAKIIFAQRARGARISFSIVELRRVPRVMFSLLIPIITSSLEASVALADTLLARGYSPARPITIPPIQLGAGDAITSLLFMFLAFMAFSTRF